MFFKLQLNLPTSAELWLQLIVIIMSAAAAAGQPEIAAHPQPQTPVMHRLTKRMDLEVCIGHFDVHKNTIIRTGESQAIGGKYLQGLELDTIEECERLCCETESCDVYIFERKAGGYCYLFECGPPENFHCKFTRHANYTSAVLTQVRHSTELASTPRPQLPHIPSNNISQQEWELSNLKFKPDVNNKAAVSAVAPTPGVVQSAVAPVQAPIGHCGRFQFTCHSGECIAVYNACDGIPQCEDGSDEGPECSAVSSTATKVSSTNNLEVAKPMVQQYESMPPVLVQQPQQQQQQQPQQVLVLGPPPPPPPPPPMVNNREDVAAWSNRKMIVDGHQSQTQQQANVQQSEILKTDKQSHIFNHKGGLQLQQATIGQAGQQQQQQGQGPVQGQIQLPNYSNNNNNQPLGGGPLYGMSLPNTGIYLPPTLQQQQQQPQQHQQLQTASVVWPQVPAKPAPIASQQQLLIPQQQSHAYSVAQAPNAPPPLPAQQQQRQSMLPVLNAAPIHGKDQPADEDYDDYEEEKSTEAPKKKQRKHKKFKSKTIKDPIELALEQNKQQHQQPPDVSLPALPVPVSPVHEQYKMIHENLALEFRDHDGHSERPGGAVLSLTMGLLVTAALAILIGCRMRTVGRRARRLGGKKPYSQEADFLVNGMYL